MRRGKRIELGKYIVSDPEICGGDLTFKGTRVLVKDVLYYVGQGKDWEWIVSAYRASISHQAISEAVSLATESLTEKVEKLRHFGVRRPGAALVVSSDSEPLR